MDPYLLLAAVEGCGPAMVPQLLDPASEPEELLSAWKVWSGVRQRG